MDLTLLTARSYFLLFKVCLWKWERNGGRGGRGRSQDGDKGPVGLTGSSERCVGADPLLLQPSPEEKIRRERN